MRWKFALAVAVAAAAAVVAPGFAKLDPRLAIGDIEESARLETRVWQLFQEDPNDAEIPELLARSEAVLRQAAKHLSGKPLADLNVAFAYDGKFESQSDPQLRADSLAFAIHVKEFVVEQIRDAWVPAGAKATKAVKVSAPACRSLFAPAPTISGCTKSDFWDINVPHDVKRAKCSFRGPNGDLRPARLLFAGTFQVTSCVLTHRRVVIDGVRKRVVHAELRITVPAGSSARGAKPVTVTAHWQ